MNRRRAEVVVATAAIVASAAFTAAVLIWHFGFDDAWWSFPVVHDWNGFELYASAEVILPIAFVGVGLFAGFLFAIRRRRLGASFLAVALPTVTAAGCAAIYWPFYGALVFRVDRLQRVVQEPAHGMEWRRGYAWLNPAEAGAFAVRLDDPAIRHCDQHWRDERVVPETWHTLGVEW